METLEVGNPSAPNVPLRVRFAGCFLVQDSTGTDISPKGRKARAIIAYLAAQPGVRVPRTRLMELFWGERGERQARDSLRHALAEIRHATGDLLGACREHLWIESTSFVEEGAPPSVTDLLEDLDHITPEFDEWLRAMRARRSAESWSRLELHVESLLSQGRGSHAMPLIEEMRRLNPYNEDWLRLALRAEYEAGHPAGIKQRFDEFEVALRRDLGVAPAVETRALHERLLRELSEDRLHPRATIRMP